MRVFYCPVHKRVTEEQFQRALHAPWHGNAGLLACNHCWQWFHGFARKSAKRAGES